MTLWLSACATNTPPDTAGTPAAQAASRTAEHIYVTEGTIDTSCFREVGEVSYVESFGAAATDPEHVAMADTLREDAVRRYPNQVDAIINVHTQDQYIGSAVEVIGEAVQLESPGKIDCKVPHTIATALSTFTTGIRTGVMHEISRDRGLNGPADAASDTEGNGEVNLGAAIGENSGASMTTQIRLRQAEIERLRTELDSTISGRCAAANVSAAQCDSMRASSADLEEPDEALAIVNRKAGDQPPSAFEIQNILQAQDELIAKLQERIADLDQGPVRAIGAGSAN